MQFLELLVKYCFFFKLEIALGRYWRVCLDEEGMR